MPTALSRFYRATRFLLDDRDAEFRQYPDATLLDGLRTALQLNRLPGYALTDDELSVTPAITDPNVFALLALHTAKLFADPSPASYSYKRRSISESFGNSYQFLETLLLEIHKLENGTMFSGWQSWIEMWNGRYAAWRAEGIGDGSGCGPDRAYFSLARRDFADPPVVPVLWFSEAPLLVGASLMGGYAWGSTMNLTTVRLTGTGGAGATVLELLVNGSGTGYTVTIPAGPDAAFDLSFTLNAVIQGGFMATWRVQSGPDVSVAAYGVNLTGTLVNG